MDLKYNKYAKKISKAREKFTYLKDLEIINGNSFIITHIYIMKLKPTI